MSTTISASRWFESGTRPHYPVTGLTQPSDIWLSRVGAEHDPSNRPPWGGAAAPVHARSRGRRRRAGADGRQVRRDVDVDELHVPVVQLPLPAGCASLL